MTTGSRRKPAVKRAIQVRSPRKTHEGQQSADRERRGAASFAPGSRPYDLVFGSGPGCQAVVAVHELESTVYGDRTVSAVVQLPEDALEPLQSRKGQPLTFEGRLRKVNALLRNIYVADGAVVG